MTATAAIIVVSCLQIVLRTSIFFEQSGDMCSPAPTLSSWIFLVAFLDLLSDMCIYPMRYMHLPFFCQVLVETLMAIVLTEFCAIVIWCSLERMFCRLVKSMLLVVGMPQRTYIRWETLILGIVTTAISLGILAYVGQATDHFHVIRKKYVRLERKIAMNFDKFWHVRVKNDYKARSTKCHMNSDYFHCQDFEDGFICTKKRRKRKSY